MSVEMFQLFFYWMGQFYCRSLYKSWICVWKYVFSSFRFALNVGVRRPLSTENSSGHKYTAFAWNTTKTEDVI